jgi:hypothetical protein
VSEPGKQASVRARTMGCVLIAMLATGCATVPPEAVVSQKLIISGIEVARRNQLELIDAYADDQKTQKRLQLEHVALPAVLQETADADGTLQVAVTQKLVAEYAADLQKQLDAIEAKAKSMREQTNRGFDELAQLASLNREYIEALKTRSDVVARLLGRYQNKVDRLQQKFSEALQDEPSAAAAASDVAAAGAE